MPDAPILAGRPGLGQTFVRGSRPLRPIPVSWISPGPDGPAGSHVRIRHAEVLAADGSLYTENLRTARQTDEFIAPGGAAVCLTPPKR